ncbi:MAG: hypothetical protein DHS20C17_22720 [Cyclobacteriaceae bacterium]|nr:MAG: hypothetical protein DHS20C17_22720 [Cyclobacteriaceae bacterium]
MKTLKIALASICILLTQMVFGQANEVNQMLGAYYEMKDALIADDGKTASTKANEVLKWVEVFPENKLSNSQLKTWQENTAKIKLEAEHISKSNDVEFQRDHLNELSGSLFRLLKGLKMNEHAVYQQYCPMKKAYWLSAEKEIKNPYYGEKMLACGSVKETLK